MGLWRLELSDGGFLAACLTLGGGLLATVLVGACPGLRRARLAKTIATAIVVAGLVVFVCGIIAMVQRQPAARWLPLLAAGLLCDLLSATVLRLARGAWVGT